MTTNNVKALADSTNKDKVGERNVKKVRLKKKEEEVAKYQTHFEIFWDLDNVAKSTYIKENKLSKSKFDTRCGRKIAAKQI